jgi:hypothetical protein
MDEVPVSWIPVSFDITSNYTVDEKGSQDIRISTTGNEKCNFIVVLCVTSDGGKCTPMVIFKRKTMPKETFPKGIIVKINSKGWMNQQMFNIRLQEVWRKRKNSLFSSN